MSNKKFDSCGMSNSEFEKIKKENGWGLTIAEFREAQKRAKKPLSITEAYILDSLWSDHCSYKHSKNKLKELIKENKYVFKSEKSDAGAVKIPDSDYCAIFKIESHNHPTLINPFDGAATGVGGVIRDIFAMGAINLGVGASLRYGPKEKPNSKDILKDSMKGAREYCGVMGIPLIALDTYFDDSFKHNCLMNVTALGIVKKDELIPNTVSKRAVGYNLIYIGKPTAGAAVGGASFASQAFEEGKTKKIEFGSNPLLERATFNVFEKVKKELKKKKLFSEISLKDMGAAGLTCSTVEQVAPKGYGVEIHTDKVPIPKGLKVAPLALAVGEDQERNMIIASEKATEVILDIIEKDKAFKKYGGKVAVIGKVIKEERFIMRDENAVYSDIPASLITEAPVYKPTSKKTSSAVKKFNIKKPKDLKKTILKLVGSKNVYSRKDIYKVFQGKPTSPNTAHQGGQPAWIVKRADETDVCVIAPLKNKKIGVALVFGGKSIHGRNGTPQEQSYLSVILGRLKLAVSGLKPLAVTDGCNYGNPDNPEHYYSFEKGIDGLNKACSIPLYKEKEPLAVVSGNVSLKNTYISQGKEMTLDPSL
ncbi:MAG: AIR synthase related protein, partial [Candidatus Ratteibacteria bacterium]|nr:AIR synthase related protein [Candidatus Ratteibacteria bacterium]